MAHVIRQDDETFEQMMNRFKREYIQDGTLIEVRKREYYRSPSQKRNEKRAAAERKRFIESKKAEKRKCH